MPKLCITKRQITALPADGIITLLYTRADGPSDTDEAIMSLANDHFHHRAEKALPLSDGTAFNVRRTQMYNIRFDNVIFVVDEGKLSVDQIVYNALMVADKEHMRVVSIGIPRCNSKKAIVFKPFEEACAAIKRACEKHHLDCPNSRLQQVNVVCPPVEQLFRRALNYI